MLDVDAWIGRNNPDIKMIMQVHDELVFEVNASKADEFADKIKDLMLFLIVQHLKNTFIFTNFILTQNNHIMTKVIKLKFLETLNSFQ
jgi:hypothetical protein